ncbi:hypothetical protein DM02DRAFT_710114 [Periconia macrospinosa]|uniref:Mid2 domain-containing protein n=1 Tax=Periconia macrospinosa TaxID=97972 RepID=A0A2V1DRQ9_9PLEO|nr:hypothetical protein DM02DRAFT_710114 [Periconia macrospinosa]
MWLFSMVESMIRVDLNLDITTTSVATGSSGHLKNDSSGGILDRSKRYKISYTSVILAICLWGLGIASIPLDFAEQKVPPQWTLSSYDCISDVTRSGSDYCGPQWSECTKAYCFALGPALSDKRKPGSPLELDFRYLFRNKDLTQHSSPFSTGVVTVIMIRTAILRVVLLLTLSIYFADAQQLYWIHPPIPDTYRNFKDNLLIESGSKQTLRWNTTRQKTNFLALYQDGVQNSLFRITDIKGMQYDWTVDSSIYNLAKSPVFYFGLNVSNSDGSDPTYQTCHYFNITAKSVTSSKSSSIISSSTTIQPSGSSPTASSVTSTTAGLNTPIPQPPVSTISTGAIAGISVACTIIVLLAIAGIGFCFWRRKKQNKAADPEPTAHAPVVDKKEIWARAELGSVHDGNTQWPRPELE